MSKLELKHIFKKFFIFVHKSLKSLFLYLIFNCRNIKHYTLQNLKQLFLKLTLYHVFEFRKLHIQSNLWSTVWKRTFFSYIAFMSHSYRLSFSQKEIKLKCHFHSFLLKFGMKLKQNQLCFCCELHSL